ncbi:hypothetical protein [Bradyrhizobium sp. RD5-C2]|uniref:hypothetical protein n=1 Tax=Bradyrhizobium sp. RD5-C2 TaxID=244562 RepID=UPI001CC4FE64|nr:hypothetical protein [Bradyrhizobium sp. RD5-C2]GIQ77088.1 hypothetical protein BraRD5C2_55360 [Bradyrhizobium sp. RD5-C2]
MLPDSSVPACTQVIAQINIPPQTIELQARKLRKRFALSPEVARMLADIAFAGEAQA